MKSKPAKTESRPVAMEKLASALHELAHEAQRTYTLSTPQIEHCLFEATMRFLDGGSGRRKWNETRPGLIVVRKDWTDMKPSGKAKTTEEFRAMLDSEGKGK